MSQSEGQARQILDLHELAINLDVVNEVLATLIVICELYLEGTFSLSQPARLIKNQIGQIRGH